MDKRRQTPTLVIVLLIILSCIFVALCVFPDFSFSALFSEKETVSQDAPDTTPPIIQCDIKSKTVTAGNTISVSKLGVRVTDKSKIESLLFTKIRSDHFYPGPSNDKIEGMKKAYADGIAVSGEEFQFTYGGIYELTVTATDAYKNSSDFTFTLKVETPPIIETPKDFYVAKNTEIPYEKFINVWDVIDGDFAFDTVTMDTSSLNIAKEGTYPIVISAKDKYGLLSTSIITVHVMSKSTLQELIDTQKINIGDHAIVGADNAYNIGTYEDASLLESAIVPALVQISNDKNDVVGDGFIIKIDDAFVTIATNASVVTDNLIVDTLFTNGFSCRAPVVFTNTEYDLAFIHIPVDGMTENSSVASETLSTLRTVHFDEDQWDKHPVTSKVSLKQLLRHYELVFKHKLITQ